jgi:hypothetical protein
MSNGVSYSWRGPITDEMVDLVESPPVTGRRAR